MPRAHTRSRLRDPLFPLCTRRGCTLQESAVCPDFDALAARHTFQGLVLGHMTLSNGIGIDFVSPRGGRARNMVPGSAKTSKHPLLPEVTRQTAGTPAAFLRDVAAPPPPRGVLGGPRVASARVACTGVAAQGAPRRLCSARGARRLCSAPAPGASFLFSRAVAAPARGLRAASHPHAPRASQVTIIMIRSGDAGHSARGEGRLGGAQASRTHVRAPAAAVPAACLHAAASAAGCRAAHSTAASAALAQSADISAASARGASGELRHALPARRVTYSLQTRQQKMRSDGNSFPSGRKVLG